MLFRFSISHKEESRAAAVGFRGSFLLQCEVLTYITLLILDLLYVCGMLEDETSRKINDSNDLPGK